MNNVSELDHDVICEIYFFLKTRQIPASVLCSVTLAVTATWINSCLFLERTEYLCEIEQYYSINKRDGNLQRIDQKSWTIDLWTGHELDMSETCNGFYNISSPCLGIEA